MNFENEDELQAFIHSFVGGQREVTFSDGSRIDVLTSKYAIEVKPKLTRSALLQALGQSTIYRANCPDKIHVVAGLTPKNTNESYATADRVRQSGTEVWYVDRIPQFIEHWDNLRRPKMKEHESFKTHSQRRKSSISNVPSWVVFSASNFPGFALFIAACILGAAFCAQQPTQQPLPVSLQSPRNVDAAPAVEQPKSASPLYTSPRSNSEVIQFLNPGSDVWITGCSGEFVAVSVDGFDGWVKANQVSGHNCGG